MNIPKWMFILANQGKLHIVALFTHLWWTNAKIIMGFVLFFKATHNYNYSPPYLQSVETLNLYILFFKSCLQILIIKHKTQKYGNNSF